MMFWVVIPCRAKLDVVRFLRVGKVLHRCFLKAMYDVLNLCRKRRILQIVYNLRFNVA